MKHIVALSGGLASAWVAIWAVQNRVKLKMENLVLYFNDTHWEHEDLYRFLDDLEDFLCYPITIDSDGRDPEQLFYDEKILGSNMVPVCSRKLKGEMLQKYVERGDIVYFGIDETEFHRAGRINMIYTGFGVWSKFPLIEQKITKEQVKEKINEIGIEIPVMYKMGFKHNNCSGGCVRQGKASWKLLLETMPDVYAERERLEREFSEKAGKKCTFLKGVSLQQVREAIEMQPDLFNDEDLDGIDCMGFCENMF
jgi:3'-phosphoadenosine 5'-phosphosulfate sulfotransferase (PAPS reductase)/FAD synthetase